jgi:hypothetical protein
MKSCKQHLVGAASVGLTSLVVILGGVRPAMAEKVIELHQEAKNANFATPFFNFSIDVPAGKRLVIESASARVSLPPGQRARASVSGNFPTGVGMQHLTLEFQGTFDGADVYTTTQPMRLYIQGPAGNQGIGIFSIVRDGTGNVFAEVSIVGFLEDVP